MLWLPLFSTYICDTNGAGPVIAPPLDIHWVWLVHLLAPQHYMPDCTAVVGQMLPHRLLTQNAHAIARGRGKTLWEVTYPNQPWEPTEENPVVIHANYVSKIKYNIAQAVSRQSAFYYQVSLCHYRRGSFIRAAIRRYRQFLHLKLKEPNAFLVPCYDTDLVWHAHQVHPSIYFNDTQMFFGRLLPHDDSVNDRSTGSKLVESDKVTRKLWQTTWNEEFRRNGGMYRGDPPNTYLSPLPPEFESNAHKPIFDIHIQKVIFRSNIPEGAMKVKFRHQFRQLSDVVLTHDGSTVEHDISKHNIKLQLQDHELTQWIVVKVAPERRLSKLLRILGRGRFWCMANFSDLHFCKTGDILTKVRMAKSQCRSISNDNTPVLTKAILVHCCGSLARYVLVHFTLNSFII